MPSYFIKTGHGIQGPYSAAELQDLVDAGDLPPGLQASSDTRSWEPLERTLERATPADRAEQADGIFVNCPHCALGTIEDLGQAQKAGTLAFTLALVVLLVLAGLGASEILLAKVEHGIQLSLSTPGVGLALGAASGLVVVGLLSFAVFRLPRKWRAWLAKECAFCDGGFVRSGEVGAAGAILYFLETFLFHEVIVPIYKALTFQWLWRDRDPASSRTQLTLRFIGFTFVIVGAVPFLLFLTARDSALGLGFAVLIVASVTRMIFLDNPKDSPYPKGAVFLMIPLYYVGIVEILRWCWVLSLGPRAIPPDVSDLYLLGADSMLATRLTFEIPSLLGLSLAKPESQTQVMTVAMFLTTALLDVALITALAKAFVQAFSSARIYKRTGLVGLKTSESEALRSVEEISHRRDPRKIGKLEESLREVQRVLNGARPYVRGVALAADPGSDLQRAAQRSLGFVAADSIEESSERQGPRSRARTGWAERLLAAAVVTAWVATFSGFFQVALSTATEREIASLLESVASADLQANPALRHALCARALRKDPDNHRVLLAAAKADFDLASLRVDMLDMDQALIDLDRGFQRLIHLQALTGLANNPYAGEQTALSAQAYALRGRAFFFRGDLERACEELRKERTQETRRLLFAIALHRACHALSGGSARQAIAGAAAELGLDSTYGPGRLVELCRVLVSVREGDLEDGARELGRLVAEAQDFTPGLRSESRRLLAEIHLRLGKPLVARQGFEEQLAGDSTDAAAAIGLGDTHLLTGDARAAFLAYSRGTTAKEPAIAERARLGQAVASLCAGEREDAVRAFLDVVRARPVDAAFRDDIRAFLSGSIDRETLILGAQRWDLVPHAVQSTLAWLGAGFDAFARDDLAKAASALRQVVGSQHAAAPEASAARALLDLCSVRREGRVYQTGTLLHEERVDQVSAMVERELRLAIFPPERVRKTVELVLAAGDSGERSRAIESASRGGLLQADELLPLLVCALADEEAVVRLAGMDGLFGLGAQANPAAPEVAAAVRDPDERVRRAAVRVMAVFGGEASVQALRTALADADRYVRRDAAYALVRLGEAALPALPELARLLDDAEVMVRDAAFSGVSAQGEEGAKLLLGVLESSRDTAISIQTVRHLEREQPALFEKERSRITGFLIGVLTKSDDPQSRRWAAQKLAGRERDKRVAAAAVLTAVQDELRQALEETGDPAVAVGLSIAWLRASSRYGLDPAPAVDRVVALVGANPGLEDAVLSGLVEPGVGLAALSVVRELLLDPARSESGARLLRTVLENQEEDADKAAESAVRILVPLVGSDDEELSGRGADGLAIVAEVCDPAVTAPLLLALLQDPNENVRFAALDLASVDGGGLPEEVSAALGEGLLSGDPGVRFAHFLLLRDVAFETPALEGAIGAVALDRDGEPEEQGAALRALARLTGAKRHTGALRDLACDPGIDPDVRVGAIVVLLAFLGPEQALGAIGEDRFARTAMASALLEWARSTDQPDGLALGLARLLEGPEREVRLAALEALARQGDVALPQAALARLTELSGSSDPELAKKATLVVACLAPETADSALLAPILVGTDAKAALRTVSGLSRRAKVDASFAETAAASLSAALASPHPAVRTAAGKTLRELGTRASDALREALVGPACLQALAVIAAQKTQARPLGAAVIPFLSSPDREIAKAAAEALGRMGETSAVATLRAVAKGAALDLQTACWVALGRLGETDSGRELERLLDSGGDDAHAIALGLLEVSPDRGVDRLIRALIERFGSLPAGTAAQLLAEQGPAAARALPTLDVLSEDKNPEIRTAALAAVMRIRGS